MGFQENRQLFSQKLVKTTTTKNSDYNIDPPDELTATLTMKTLMVSTASFLQFLVKIIFYDYISIKK
jgi:hypothetical protein